MGSGERRRRNVPVTANQGYGSEAFVEVMAKYGLSPIFVTPEKPLSELPSSMPPISMPAVMASTLKEDVDPDDMSSGAMSSTHSFIMDDRGDLGPFTCAAKKLTPQRNSSRWAYCVLEPSPKGLANLARLLLYVPSFRSESLNAWFANGNKAARPTSLFTTYTVSGHSWKETVREALRQISAQLMQVQRCAHWFILRRFRVTPTVATMVYMEDPKLGQLFKMQGLLAHPKEHSKWLQKLSDRWFSSRRATEDMMWGQRTKT